MDGRFLVDKSTLYQQRLVAARELTVFHFPLHLFYKMQNKCRWICNFVNQFLHLDLLEQLEEIATKSN